MAPSIGADFRKRADRKRGAGNDAQRDGEEAEARPRERAEVPEVLDDKDLLGEEARVHETTRIVGVVHVPELDADERGPRVEQELERLGRDVRPRLPVGIGPQRASQPVRTSMARPASCDSSASSETARSPRTVPSSTKPGTPATASNGIWLRSRASRWRWKGLSM
jgi:hypothetical protein